MRSLSISLISCWWFIVACCCAPVPLLAAEPAPPKERPTNRLARETSPYLLLHAHNPVDWYPWGDEALEKAKTEGKLIFLSIGYSSCYWCHVMERESFTDAEIAALLNEHFVCIKVDREERPDIDEVYMRALQLYYRLSGSPRAGGWPLSMFLTPEAEPFVGGTYFPPRDGERGTGFLSVVQQIQGVWKDRPDGIRVGARQLSALVSESLKDQPPLVGAPPDAAWPGSVVEALAEQYDPDYDGFGFSDVDSQRPKFPEPSNLLLLADRARRADDQRARSMLIETLTYMSAAGIHDHVGGGFHRYSTDRFWRVPHFEKMLYDNAQLASALARAFELTGDEQFRLTVDQLIAFVLREMRAPEGGFYSAIDAETDAQEGAFYVWTREQVQEILSGEDYESFAPYFGFDRPPNFEGHFIVQRPFDADRPLLPLPEEFLERWPAMRAELLEARDRRPRPLTDTKVLTDWNGLMIRGLADAGRLLDQPAYVEHAQATARFLLEHARAPDGRLQHVYAAGQAKVPAFLDDYAFLIDGLLALFESTGEGAWIDAASELQDEQIERFWDADAGGFFFTADDQEKLIARSKDPIDSALPSGNAVSVGNLVALSAHAPEKRYLDLARQTLEAFGGQMKSAPSAMPRMAVSLAAFYDAESAPPDAPPAE